MPLLLPLISTFAALSLLAVAQPAAQPPGQPAPAQPDPSQPAPQPVEVQTPPIEIKVRDPKSVPGAPAVPGRINTADDLLLALENADADLRSLSADLRYDRTFEIAGDRQVREGKL